MTSRSVAIADLIPAVYGKFQGVQALAMSGTNNSGNFNILFNALIPGHGGGGGMFLLTLVKGGAENIIRQVLLPDNVRNITYGSGPIQVNANGLLATKANLLTPKEMARTGAPAPGPLRAILLVPVQLIDTKGSTLGNGKNVVISPKQEADDENPAAIAWIEPHGAANGIDPTMPSLVLTAGADDSMGYSIRWKLMVEYTRPNGDSVADDTVHIPAAGNGQDGWVTEQLNAGPVQIASNTDWINACHRGYFGGKAQLTYQLLKSDNTPLTDKQTILFDIAGKNPNYTICENYITQQCTSVDSHLWFSYAIAKHESKDYNGGESRYNQFWDSHGHRFNADHRDGDPLWCKSPSEESAGGFGMFQITGDAAHGKYYNIPRDRLWNWESNMQAYIGIMKTEGSASKMPVASRFFAAVSAYYPTPPYETPPSDCTKFANVFYKMSAYDADIITLYNGAGGSTLTRLNYPDGSHKTFYNPWKFYPQKPSGWKWYYYINPDVNDNYYLQNVIKEFNK